jgi:hypothetical protein
LAISERDRRVLIIGGVIVVGVVLWSVLNPADSPKTQAKMLPLPQAKQKLEVNIRTLKRLSSERDETEPRIARLTYNLTPEEVVPRVIRDLQTVAVRAQVRLREVKPLRPRELPSGQGQSVPMEVRFRAPFLPNAIRFLYFIESPDGKIVVDKLNITSAEARFKTVDVSAQITVFTRKASAPADKKEGESTNARATNQQPAP